MDNEPDPEKVALAERVAHLERENRKTQWSLLGVSAGLVACVFAVLVPMLAGKSKVL
jgi:hypothetical protein